MPRSAAAGFILAATGLVLIVVLVTACGPSSTPAGSAALAPSGAASAPAASSPESRPGASPHRSGSTPASPSAGASPEEAVWLPEWAGEDVPAPVAHRQPLPFCGVERAPAPQPGIFIDRAIRLCFWNAHLARQPAEFVSIQTTIEGAPIATIYRLAGDGTVEVLTDATQDPYGGGWSVQNCAGVVAAEGQELLGVADCVEGAPLG